MENDAMEPKTKNLKRKLNSFTIEEKIEILEAVDEGGKKMQIAKDYNIPNSTLSTILKNRAKIERLFEQGRGGAKKIRVVGFPDLEKSLKKWFDECRERQVPVRGRELKEKAEQLAEALGLENFKCSNGWMQNFKKRHNIAFRKLHIYSFEYSFDG